MANAPRSPEASAGRRSPGGASGDGDRVIAARDASPAALPRIVNHPVPPRLLPFIERAVTVDYRGAVGACWQVLPSGCFGMRAILDADDPDHGFGRFERRCLISGVPSRAFDARCASASLVLAVALTPRAIAQIALDRHPLDALADAPARPFVSRESAERLGRDLADARQLPAKAEAWLAWLERLLCDTPPAHGRKAAIAEVASRMRLCETLSIVDAARRVGVTRRQLERDFRRHLGTSPKAYAQVATLQRMAQLSWQGLGLAAIAAELEYTDQSHMTRAVKALTGLTPGVLLARAGASPLTQATRPWWNGRITYL